MDHHAERRDRVVRLLREEGLAAVLVTSPVNVTYLTGFTGDTTALVLTADRAVLVSDPRYVGQIADECPELETYIRPPVQKLHEAIAAVLTKLGASAVGCESAALTLAEAEALREAAPAIDWKPATDRVERFRMVKDAVELRAIRAAIDIAERAFAAFCALLRPEDTEVDLANAMDAFLRRCGAIGSAFPPIIAVGERAALPHCPPTGKRVREAELLLVDWGAVGPTGYRSDLTRVLPTRTTGTAVSRADDRLAAVHAAVLRAQQAAIAAVRPGAVGKTIDAAARAALAEVGYESYFNHGLGHGIGLQTHEAPNVRQGSEVVLEAGMVLTIEPGVYLPGWGGVRIEDDVLVTPDGCEVLTRVPRELGSLRAFGK